MSQLCISDTFAGRLSESRRVVVLTGAGASAESGIPTFRGEGGLWGEFRAEDLATPDAFERNPKLVWDWYMWRRASIRRAFANAGHLALAILENHFGNVVVITQNVDGLHQRAGSQNVVEIHGNILRSRCHACGEPAGSIGVDEKGQLPACQCGGLIRPDVVWFGELLPVAALQRAWKATSEADVFLSVGTSSLVQPAAGLADRAKRAGAYLIEINPEPTEISGLFDEVLRGPAGVALPAICRGLGLNISTTARVSS